MLEIYRPAKDELQQPSVVVRIFSDTSPCADQATTLQIFGFNSDDKLMMILFCDILSPSVKSLQRAMQGSFDVQNIPEILGHLTESVTK